MRVLSVVGPFGVGKTTLVRKLIHTLHEQGYDTKTKVCFIVNDEGKQVDGELAADRAQVVALTSGCFTCSDVGELRLKLKEQAESGIAWVLLEGFGIVAGNETLELLKSTPYQYHIVTLLSERHLEQDKLRYSTVLKSHIQVATVGIGITKTAMMDEVSEAVLDFIASVKPGLNVFPLARDEEPPAALLDLIKSDERARPTLRPISVCKHCDEEHQTGQGHHHGHSHHDVHGAFPYYFALLPEVTLAKVQVAFAGLDYIWRVKGAVEGMLFNAVHGEWVKTTPDVRQFVTFYATRAVSLSEDLPQLMSLIVPNSEDGVTSMPSYQQLREEAGTREETVTEIKQLLAQIPREPILIAYADGLKLDTHPEDPVQVVKEISRRKSVIDEWFPVVLKALMQYWLDCAQVFRQRQSELRPGDVGKNQRELAASLAWWINRFGSQFGPEMIESTQTARPGQLMAKGIMSLSSLNADPVWAYWQCEEYVEALQYGLMHGESREEMLTALNHCLTLAAASGNEPLRQQWEQKLKDF